MIDYRLVNKSLLDDKFPLPNMREILDSLGAAIYFTHLDLAQGYYQLELDEASRTVTAFTGPNGQYQMKRLPMGLKICPSAFSRMITVAMSGLNLSECFNYLDDLIVFGKSLADHNANLFAVLNRLRKVNLKLNVEKCQFFKKSIVYLGHTISEQGILPDESNVEVIRSFPRPNRVDELKRFEAMVNYYRNHIGNFAAIAKPLNDLTRKDVPFIWNDSCEKAFLRLKTLISSPPILDFPDFSENNTFQ